VLSSSRVHPGDSAGRRTSYGIRKFRKFGPAPKVVAEKRQSEVVSAAVRPVDQPTLDEPVADSGWLGPERRGRFASAPT